MGAPQRRSGRDDKKIEMQKEFFRDIFSSCDGVYDVLHLGYHDMDGRVVAGPVIAEKVNSLLTNDFSRSPCGAAAYNAAIAAAAKLCEKESQKRISDARFHGTCNAGAESLMVAAALHEQAEKIMSLKVNAEKREDV